MPAYNSYSTDFLRGYLEEFVGYHREKDFAPTLQDLKYIEEMLKRCSGPEHEAVELGCPGSPTTKHDWWCKWCNGYLVDMHFATEEKA